MEGVDLAAVRPNTSRSASMNDGFGCRSTTVLHTVQHVGPEAGLESSGIVSIY
jgi:hypothetical protein